MGRINLKTDYEDGNILHGSELNINNNVTMLGVNDNFDQITKLKLSKADLTYVDNSLSTKADLATLNTKVQEIDLLKANRSELATKANQSDLDKKANKTYVDEQLELKANQTQVYNELQKKVDKDIYEEAISNKVDSETVGDLRELKTDDKSSIVKAINSINTEAKSIATVDKVGVVKPDGTTITIDQDGTIHSLGGGGGTGGTTNYNDLANKPQINDVEIKGNLSLEELGLMSSIDTENALAKKANSSDVYNKEHIDIIESQLADKANTADVNSKLETKANIEDVYNKTTVDELFVAESSKTDAKLLNKADSNNVYSKDIVDDKISKKADNIDFNNESKQLQLTSNGALIGDPVTLEVTGNEVIIGNVQPSEEDANWKIWINSDEVQNLGSEVVDTLDGNETDKAPSVNAVNNALNSKPNIKSNYSNSKTDTYSCEYSNIAFMPKSAKVGITDMNSADACRVGIYTGNNVDNAPTTGYVTWLTLTHNNNSTYCTQICAVLGSAQLYVRYRRENSFGSWNTLIK